MLAPKGEQERAEPVTYGEGNRSDEEPEKQSSRTLRCRESGMLREQTMEQERSHLVAGTEPP